MSLNMSGFTGASTYQDISSNRSEVNTTITDATEPNLNFAPNRHRKDLPIFQHRDEIVQKINENPIAIITGLTGKMNL
jgi:HrpA-like RNA helicase